MKHRRERHHRAEPTDWPTLIRAGVLGGAIALVISSVLVFSEAAIPKGSYASIAMGWCVLLMLWSLAAWLDPQPVLRWGWTELAAAPLIGWHSLAAIAALGHTNGRQALNSMWLFIGYGLTAFLLRQTLRTAVQVRALVASMIWLALLLATFGYYQYFISMPAQRRAYEANPEQTLRDSEQATDPDSRRKFENRLYSREPLATFALTNSLAGVLAPWLCAVLAIGLSVRRDPAQRRTLLAMLLIALAIAGCLVLTKSRTAYLAAGFGLALVALYCRPDGWRIGWRLPAAIGGVAVVLGLAAVYLGGLDAQVLSEAPKSALYRIEYWRATAALIADHPLLGCGPGNFQEAYAAYQLPQASETVADPHNFLLEVWATSGTPAVLLLLLLGVAFVIDLTRAARTAIPPDKDGATTGPSSWTVFGGTLAGLILAAPIAYVAGYPLDNALTRGYVPVVWLLGFPLLAATWWSLWTWIQQGRLQLAALIVPMVVLLVNLLAAGAVRFPGVIATLLVLTPAALCLASQSAAASAGSDLRDRPQLPRTAVAAAGLSAIGLTVLCLLTEYHPVLISRAALEAGMAEWTAGRKDAALVSIEQAVAADPRCPETWQSLAELRKDHWLATEADADWKSFMAAADGLAKHDPQHHLAYYARGGWLLTAWRKTGRAELLEQAIEEYRRTILRYPNRALYHAQLAWTLHLAGRDDEARTEADVAHRLDDLTPHSDQKLAVQRIVDPQIAAGGVTQQRKETAEQLVEQLRTKGGNPVPKDKLP